MEYPKAHRIGRRKSAREFKNPKEISPKPQNKINMLTKIPKESRYINKKKEEIDLISFIYKEILSYLPYNRVCFL
jgi:hypothetical protein